MKIQDCCSVRLLRLLLLLVMALATVNLCSSFIDISYQLKLYRNMFKGKTLEMILTTSKTEIMSEATETITTILRIIHNPYTTESKTHKLITAQSELDAHNIKKPLNNFTHTQHRSKKNKTQRHNAQITEIMLNVIDVSTPTQNEYQQINTQSESSNTTQDTLSTTNESLDTKETTSIEEASEKSTADEKMNMSATTEVTESTLNQNFTIPLSHFYCNLSSDLGPVEANKTTVELAWVETLYPEVDRGGMYTPPNCTARHRVAIFVPYRDREEHLAIFLRHIHQFLMKQQLEYGIYVIEQLGNSDFNKGILYNAVFMEAQGLRPVGWDCFIFQDIDLLPLDLRNIYSCPIHPRHMSVAVDTLENKLMYRNMFGGVTALSAAQFIKVNGYSNMYWGWGGEDDDISKRLRHLGYIIGRSQATIARYTMLPHKRRTPNPNRIRILRQAIKNYQHDGLSSVKYDLVDIVRHHLYTLIQIDVDKYANDTFITKSTMALSNAPNKSMINTTVVPVHST